MVQIIANTARISARVIKDGSVAGRDAFCEKLENKLFNSLEKVKHRKFECICKNIQDILPSKLVQVEKIPNDDMFYSSSPGAVVLANDAEKIIPADVVGYIVSLKPNCIKEGICGINVGVLMHEMHHLFNYFTHPKIPNRVYKVSKIPSSNTNFERFFVDNFQSPMFPSKCEAITEQLLQKMPEHKVDILQFLRYKLIDEIGAYYSGEKFENFFNTKLSKKSDPYFESQVDILYLREKLVMITDMLKTVLKAKRDNLHK